MKNFEVVFLLTKMNERIRMIDIYSFLPRLNQVKDMEE